LTWKQTKTARNQAAEQSTSSPLCLFLT